VSDLVPKVSMEVQIWGGQWVPVIAFRLSDHKREIDPGTEKEPVSVIFSKLVYVKTKGERRLEQYHPPHGIFGLRYVQHK
jgi:hypothetical protein